MIITGMDHFQSVCKKKLVEWYNNNREMVYTLKPPIDLSNVFIVWSCKTLQNYKCLASTTVSGDGIYAEYTYNGDKQELYEDVYKKLTNTCHTEEQMKFYKKWYLLKPLENKGFKNKKVNETFVSSGEILWIEL